MKTKVTATINTSIKNNFIEGNLYIAQNNNSSNKYERIILCTKSNSELIGIEIYHISNGLDKTRLGFKCDWVSENFNLFSGEIKIVQD
jgi:hypothetical protein